MPTTILSGAKIFRRRKKVGGEGRRARLVFFFAEEVNAITNCVKVMKSEVWQESVMIVYDHYALLAMASASFPLLNSLFLCLTIPFRE